MKIGILGGTFDPIHLGHIELARAAIETLGLDEVIFLPAHRNPLKKARSAPAKHRLEMVRIALQGEPKLALSDVEISRGGPSYMVESLMELQMVEPGDYWLLLGADAVRGFDQWRSPEKILKLARLAVAVRPPMTETDLRSRLSPEIREKTDFIRMKPVDISATELRDRIARKSGPLAPYLPPAVIQYIKQSHLYGS